MMVVVQWELCCSGQLDCTPHSVVHKICSFNIKKGENNDAGVGLHCADVDDDLISSFIWFLLQWCSRPDLPPPPLSSFII